MLDQIWVELTQIGRTSRRLCASYSRNGKSYLFVGAIFASQVCMAIAGRCLGAGWLSSGRLVPHQAADWATATTALLDLVIG
jgi:hypothetical protein